MRKVILSLVSAVTLAGCATVSMIPGTTIVEATLSSEQSTLRNASEAYVQTAEDENWVQPSGGIMDLAKVLMDGVSGDQDGRAGSYLEMLEADIADPEVRLTEIDMDVREAATRLAAITTEAQAFIADPTAAEAIRRSDVMSFETSLVTAQKARTSFIEALQSVASQGSFDMNPTQDALTDLDHAIRDARKMADTLADLRAGRTIETS
ncbi:MAG: hypothetical protein AAFZ91_12250 [Pseudomonadota bacterium]